MNYRSLKGKGVSGRLTAEGINGFKFRSPKGNVGFRYGFMKQIVRRCTVHGNSNRIHFIGGDSWTCNTQYGKR